MWIVASSTRSTKPLHHISINPFKDERLTDEQVLKIVERCEQKYGYKPNDHQRVIVEHVLNGRQHFHVVWNRVNLSEGKVKWPGEHWKKSKQAAREMEAELGLKRPTPKRIKSRLAIIKKSGRLPKVAGRYNSLKTTQSQSRTAIHTSTAKEALSPQIPVASKKGWPEAAIRDWETWGHRNPPRFFKLWPELGL